MNPSIVRRPEQIKLIIECRQSGLSDYQWCKTKNIHPGTFYNWASKLRKSGYTFLESQSKTTGIPVRQEVVRLNLTGHEISVSVMVEQNVSHLPLSASSNVSAEIRYGNIILRLFNGADIFVVQNTLQCIILKTSIGSVLRLTEYYPVSLL